MTTKYKNVYIKDVSTIVGPYEFKGPLSKRFDKHYDDMYFGTDSLESAEIQLMKDSIDLILNNLNFIMKDCYGNFIIQFIFFKFDKNKFDEIVPIIEKIEENMVDFCTNKFSSSVIEKSFEKNERKIGERFIKCLFEHHANDIIDILLNSYGKYVIKKACNFENKLFRNMISKTIIGKLNQMKEEGEKIIQIIKNDYPEFSFLFYEQGKYY